MTEIVSLVTALAALLTALVGGFGLLQQKRRWEEERKESTLSSVRDLAIQMRMDPRSGGPNPYLKLAYGHHIGKHGITRDDFRRVYEVVHGGENPGSFDRIIPE